MYNIFSMSILANKITTSLDWDDLVLDITALESVEEISNWIKHGNTILGVWGLSKHIKPGYRALFYGPPGTGKTFAACLLGKSAGLDVYRVDLSLVISKYIGETEKNLAKIFDEAEDKNWLLFFDEADALFGKRTDIADAHDKYANQEISYLLQWIEAYTGIVILASNTRINFDEAFTRRFQSQTYFPMPDAAHRKILWQKAFSGKLVLEDKIDIDQLASNYELSGGAIMHILKYSSNMALKRNSNTIFLKDIMEGIRREFVKGS